MWHNTSTYNIPHSYMTRPIHVWHSSFICDTRPIGIWHDTFMWDMTHSHVTCPIHIRHASRTCDTTHSCVTWLVHMWHASFLRDICVDISVDTSARVVVLATRKQHTATVCCSVVQCAHCNRVLQRVAVCCSVLRCVGIVADIPKRVVIVATWELYTLQHIATARCNSVMQCIAVCWGVFIVIYTPTRLIVVAMRGQHTASHCTTLQQTAPRCNMLQHTATCCNTLPHTATHCRCDARVN